MTLGASKAPRLSGLLDHILPIFKAASNVSVHAVGLDPSDASAIEKRGDANALLLDSPGTANKIVADGYGLSPRMAIYLDYVIIGPESDPAGIRGLTDAGKAFAQIAAKRTPFASGGDADVHRLELRLWKSAGIDPDRQGVWYRKVGQGTEATLNAAATTGAYALVDRTGWANFKNRQNLQILAEGDAALIDVYGSILVSPDKEPRNKFVYARIWHDWITDKHGFAAVTSYKINGEQIFFPCQGSTLALCRAASRQ